MKYRHFLTILSLFCVSQSFGQLWGENNSRTEFKNNAETLGGPSGFFQTGAPPGAPSPTILNFPALPAYMNPNWHLLDVRSVDHNSESMQLASAFYDQKLYFRNTNQFQNYPWKQVVTDFYNGDILIDGNLEIKKVLTSHRVAISGGGGGDGIIQGNYFTPGLSIVGINNDNTYRKIVLAGSIRQSETEGPNSFKKVTYFEDGVGINTTNTGGYKLAVNGDMVARRIKITQGSSGSWPDYVFDKNYKLPSLDSVQAYINEHKHLPDLPSAKEVGANGIDVGDNQATLLKKVEELTLYLLQMKQDYTSQLEKQSQKIKALEEKLKEKN